MSNNFDLRKFLTENKLTSNSRMVKEENEEYEFYFGYELPPITDVVDYLESNYDSSDYKLHIGYGDDLPNAVTILNKQLMNDSELLNLLDSAAETEEEDY